MTDDARRIAATRRPRRRARRRRRPRSTRPRARSPTTTARSAATDDRTVDTTSYRLVIPWFGWIFALADPRHACAAAAPGDGTQPAWAPPDRLDADAGAGRSDCSPRRRCRPRSSTRCSPRPSTSPPTTSGSSERGQGIAGVIVRCGIVLALPFAVPRRPGRATADHRAARVARADRARRSARSRRTSGCSPRPQTVGRPLGHRARPAHRGRRRGGDAAQQPRVRGERAGDGQRPRRRASR